jgi:hypothetical protein
MPCDLIRWAGAACIAGGIFIAAFVLIHPWDQLVGSEIARTAQWRTAHTFHFIGATFSLLGLVGIYAQARDRLKALGDAGFVVSFIGNAMFLGTGMITAFIWPMLATHAPGTVDLGGAIFSAPVSATAFLLTAVAMTVGYILFGVDLLRTHAYPRVAIVMLVVGAILGMLPPHPVTVIPWAAIVLGGVLYGIAMIWLGVLLWRGKASAT